MERVGLVQHLHQWGQVLAVQGGEVKTFRTEGSYLFRTLLQRKSSSSPSNLVVAVSLRSERMYHRYVAYLSVRTSSSSMYRFCTLLFLQSAFPRLPSYRLPEVPSVTSLVQCPHQALPKWTPQSRYRIPSSRNIIPHGTIQSQKPTTFATITPSCDDILDPLPTPQTIQPRIQEPQCRPPPRSLIIIQQRNNRRPQRRRRTRPTDRHCDRHARDEGDEGGIIRAESREIWDTAAGGVEA